MSDRLSDLRRQRALAQEQLAWLDREIARETAAMGSGPKPAAAPSAPPATAPLPVAPVPVVPLATADPDAILNEYRVTPAAVHQDVKKGCYLYFFAAFAGLGLFLIILYFLIGRR